MSIEIDVDIQIEQDHFPPGRLEAFLADVCRTLLTQEGCAQGEVSLVLVNDAEIHELNRTFRGVDRPTDVLSFPLLEADLDEPSSPDVAGLHLGDVVISWDRAVAQAEEYAHPLRRELAFLTVHGLLHLLGHDHDAPESETRMRAREEECLTRLGLKR